MRTNKEILATWETEGRYTDWYSIDSYNPISGGVSRLFVGTEEEATKIMIDNYATPTEYAMQPFYRCALISESEAREYFEGISREINEPAVMSLTEAAEMLGVSRQRVHVLLTNGNLDGYKVGNTWNISRDSVNKRMAKLAVLEPLA